MTHGDLVVIAAKWLAGKYPVVITELVTGGGESPDALAFSARESVVIECKATRSDFMADKKKLVRARPEQGMGNRRFYCAPKGLIKKDEIPEYWGLLEVDEETRKPRRVKNAGRVAEKNGGNEIGILVSVLRRVGHACAHPVSIRAYQHQTKCTATVSVAAEARKGKQ